MERETFEASRRSTLLMTITMYKDMEFVEVRIRDEGHWYE
jgi:hypothetical protein